MKISMLVATTLILISSAAFAESKQCNVELTAQKTIVGIAKQAGASWVQLSAIDLKGTDSRVYSFFFPENVSYFSQVQGTIVINKSSCQIVDKKLDNSNFTINLRNN